MRPMARHNTHGTRRKGATTVVVNPYGDQNMRRRRRNPSGKAIAKDLGLAALGGLAAYGLAKGVAKVAPLDMKPETKGAILLATGAAAAVVGEVAGFPGVGLAIGAGSAALGTVPVAEAAIAALTAPASPPAPPAPTNPARGLPDGQDRMWSYPAMERQYAR